MVGIANMQKLEFDDSYQFKIQLSDRKTIELKKGGAETNVTYDNRYEYIQRALITRLTESTQQILAIKRGLYKIIPAPLFKIMTHRDIEIAVCGRKTIDFDLLKRHTRYSLNLNEDLLLIKNLWEMLNELQPDDRIRFVKFCWGQERLPENDEAFERNHIRFMIKPNLDRKRP